MPQTRIIKWIIYAGALSTVAVFGQPPQPLTFDAASVKSADGKTRGSMRGGPGTADPGQITFTDVTLYNALLRAYSVKTFQLSAPEWLSTRKYEVIAKVPPGTTKEQCNVMLQNLLAERFHLTLHHETKELRGYELVIGKAGPKLKPSTESRPPAPEPTSAPKVDANGFPQLNGPGLIMMEGVKGKAVISYLTARAQFLSALVEMLSKEFRLPIVDKTGLSGKFDFMLEFAPEPPGALPPPSVEVSPDIADQSGPNLITAVQQQLGLKLNPSKVPVDVLIVDHADQIPTEN